MAMDGSKVTILILIPWYCYNHGNETKNLKDVRWGQRAVLITISITITITITAWPEVKSFLGHIHPWNTSLHVSIEARRNIMTLYSSLIEVYRAHYLYVP